MTNEKEFIEYVTNRVEFDGDYCGENCRSYDLICWLFDIELDIKHDETTDWFSKFIRCENCKKYFND
jgi:hypothetical protein